MISLLDNLLASGLISKDKTTTTKLSSLLSGLAPLVADAPARAVVAPQLDVPAQTVVPRRRQPRASYNPLSGLMSGLSPQFLDMLSRKRFMRESVLFPSFSKREGRS